MGGNSTQMEEKTFISDVVKQIYKYSDSNKLLVSHLLNDTSPYRQGLYLRSNRNGDPYMGVGEGLGSHQFFKLSPIDKKPILESKLVVGIQAEAPILSTWKDWTVREMVLDQVSKLPPTQGVLGIWPWEGRRGYLLVKSDFENVTTVIPNYKCRLTRKSSEKEIRSLGALSIEQALSVILDIYTRSF